MANSDAPVESGITQDDIDAAIERAVQRTREAMQAEHAIQMDALRQALTAGVVTSPIPEHSGGPGVNVQPTWSLYDQQLAARGEHPLQQR